MQHLASGRWVSGEDIASLLGVSRAAVWKQIRALKRRGYRIEAAPGRGYRLAEGSDLLDAESILLDLKTEWLGHDLRCLQEVTSTNELAVSAARGCRDGTVFLAEIQTQGKGRLSRPWSSPPGGVWMSLVLKPAIPLSQAYRINMAVSVAVSRAIEHLYGLEAGIKWPNDILIAGRKVCGILMEVSAELDRLEYAVVGVGLNANIDASSLPEEWMATSLQDEIGGRVSRVELIREILLETERACGRIEGDEIPEEWRRRSVTLGRRVRVASIWGTLEGEALDLAEDGALLLEADGVKRRVLAGDCIHLRAKEER